MITICVTLAVTLAIEQVPKEQEVAHGATINLDAGKTLCWAGEEGRNYVLQPRLHHLLLLVNLISLGKTRK